MALEQSINLDSKTTGGIIGISQRPGAVERWFLTCHKRAAITTPMKDMCDLEYSYRVGTHSQQVVDCHHIKANDRSILRGRG